MAGTPPIDIDAVLNLDNQLCFPLWAASKAVVRRYTPLLDELGLTYTQYITLMALWEQDAMSVGALGKRLYLDSGTLTPLLKKLEAKGLITRTRSTDDERSLNVSLTKEGRTLKQRASRVPLAIAGCINLSPDEALQLVGLLRKVLDDTSCVEAGAA